MRIEIQSTQPPPRPIIFHLKNSALTAWFQPLSERKIRRNRTYPSLTQPTLSCMSANTSLPRHLPASVHILCS